MEHTIAGTYQATGHGELFECSVNESSTRRFYLFNVDETGHGRLDFSKDDSVVVIVGSKKYDSIIVRCDVLVILGELSALKGNVSINANRVVVFQDKKSEEKPYKILNNHGILSSVKIDEEELQLIRDDINSTIDAGDAEATWGVLKKISSTAEESQVVSGKKDRTPSPKQPQSPTEQALKFFNFEQ